MGKDNGRVSRMIASQTIDNPKPWYASKGMWGAVLTIASTAFPSAAYLFGAISPEMMSEIMLAIFGTATAGGLLSGVGRLRARRPIGRKQTRDEVYKDSRRARLGVR